MLEIMVAVFITTVVIAVVYGSFFQIIDAKEKVEKELDLLHEARVIFSRIGKDLSNVALYYEKGVRYITLVHSSNNDLADSATDPNGAEYGGISDFGSEVVQGHELLACRGSVTRLFTRIEGNLAKLYRILVLEQVWLHNDNPTNPQQGTYSVELNEGPIAGVGCLLRFFTDSFQQAQHDATLCLVVRGNTIRPKARRYEKAFWYT